VLTERTCVERCLKRVLTERTCVEGCGKRMPVERACEEGCEKGIGNADKKKATLKWPIKYLFDYLLKNLFGGLFGYLTLRDLPTRRTVFLEIPFREQRRVMVVPLRVAISLRVSPLRTLT
jgi:hypothetical protein